MGPEHLALPNMFNKLAVVSKAQVRVSRKLSDPPFSREYLIHVSRTVLKDIAQHEVLKTQVSLNNVVLSSLVIEYASSVSKEYASSVSTGCF